MAGKMLNFFSAIFNTKINLKTQKMSEKKVKTAELLNEAATEIKSLRKNIREQNLQLEMFNKCWALFNIEPPRQGLVNSPDIVFDLNKEAQTLLEEVKGAEYFKRKE